MYNQLIFPVLFRSLPSSPITNHRHIGQGISSPNHVVKASQQEIWSQLLSQEHIDQGNQK